MSFLEVSHIYNIPASRHGYMFRANVQLAYMINMMQFRRKQTRLPLCRAHGSWIMDELHGTQEMNA